MKQKRKRRDNLAQTFLTIHMSESKLSEPLILGAYDTLGGSEYGEGMWITSLEGGEGLRKMG